MKKVLWFSRHDMTETQKAALGECEIKQVSATIAHAWDIQAEIDEVDIVAIVAPIGLQAEFLKVSGGKPVLIAVNDRHLVRDPETGSETYEFVFVKWEQLDRVEVIKHDWHPDED